MRLRLTYEGPLLGASRGNTRARHKHDIRKVFHKQLKKFWLSNRFLANERVGRDGVHGSEFTLNEFLSGRFRVGNYRCVPLVTRIYDLHCELDILVLRPEPPGAVLRSGDIDNRVKTLLDALRLPTNEVELGGHGEPEEGEDPFYVLMEDDKFIDRLSIEADTMLQPTATPENANDARLVISVKVRPYFVGIVSAGYL